MQLQDKGVLDKYNVKILGTNLESVKISESRELFNLRLQKLGIDIIPSKSIQSLQYASQVGEDIGIESQSFGPSVALSSDGMTLVVGSDSVSGESGLLAGQVSVYRLVSGSWAKVGDDIPGGFVQERSGYSVDISSDGEIVAIGAPSNSEQGTRSGVVRVFRYSSAGWNQVGADLRGGSKDGVFGRSVSLSGDGYTVAIGAPGQGTSVDGKAK